MYTEKNFFRKSDPLPILVDSLKSGTTPSYLLPQCLFHSSGEVFKRTGFSLYWLAVEKKLQRKMIECLYTDENHVSLRRATTLDDIIDAAKIWDKPWLQGGLRNKNSDHRPFLKNKELHCWGY